MSYGAHAADGFTRASGYVARILKGARPEDLPFQQSSELELVVNLNAAKALGITIPPGLQSVPAG